VEKDEGFDGFITRDGELVSIKDTGRVSAIFLKTADVDSAVGILWHLAMECHRAGHYAAACEYIERIAGLVDSPDGKAECFLRMGDAMEHARDYEAAQNAYERAFDLPQERDETWYFLNNNRGYCLNQIGRHFEAEKYCRAAIEIDFERHNAHKNLGVALANQGRHAEAVKEYICATRLHPSDSRALALLDDLYAVNKEILEEIPNFRTLLLECHELVQGAKGESLLQ
jgi:tetratricopeptide (TPR) repeat protein